MGQSHSAEVTQHNQSKRRSFLITPKKLIRLRRQTSHENSGAAQQTNITQTLIVGENDYHKTADGHGMYIDIVHVFKKNQNKTACLPFLSIHTLYSQQLFRYTSSYSYIHDGRVKFTFMYLSPFICVRN